MTRINCVPVTELHDKHLMAEYRELPRVLKLARHCDDAPDEYVLGTGHVKFFYNKLRYLRNRYVDIVCELLSRGFKLDTDIINSVRESFAQMNASDLYNDWKPDARALEINRHRLSERRPVSLRRVE